MSETEAQDTVAAYRKKFGILDSHLEISNASRKSLVAAGFTRHYAKKICNAQDVYVPDDLIRSTGMFDV